MAVLERAVAKWNDMAAGLRLPLAPFCDLDSVRAAYRTAALKCHPDKEGGDASRFCALDEAYKTLVSAMAAPPPSNLPDWCVVLDRIGDDLGGRAVQLQRLGGVCAQPDYTNCYCRACEALFEIAIDVANATSGIAKATVKRFLYTEPGAKFFNTWRRRFLGANPVRDTPWQEQFLDNYAGKLSAYPCSCPFEASFWCEGCRLLLQDAAALANNTLRNASGGSIAKATASKVLSAPDIWRRLRQKVAAASGAQNPTPPPFATAGAKQTFFPAPPATSTAATAAAPPPPPTAPPPPEATWQSELTTRARRGELVLSVELACSCYAAFAVHETACQGCSELVEKLAAWVNEKYYAPNHGNQIKKETVRAYLKNSQHRSSCWAPLAAQFLASAPRFVCFSCSATGPPCVEGAVNRRPPQGWYWEGAISTSSNMYCPACCEQWRLEQRAALLRSAESAWDAEQRRRIEQFEKQQAGPDQGCIDWKPICNNSVSADVGYSETRAEEHDVSMAMHVATEIRQFLGAHVLVKIGFGSNEDLLAFILSHGCDTDEVLAALYRQFDL